jgi:hypothetical protein
MSGGAPFRLGVVGSARGPDRHGRNGAARWLQGAIFVVSLLIVWLGLTLAH